MSHPSPEAFVPDKEKMKNSMGHYFTQSLFLDTYTPVDVEPVYTLRDYHVTTKDGKYYPSLYLLYMEMEDLTEFDFANKYLGGWDHWCRINKAAWFQDYIGRWREELLLKVQARALAQIKATARTNSKDAFQAQKYLLDKGWIPKDKNTKGRPSKEMIKQEAAKVIEFNKQIKEDMERLVG